MVVLNLSRYPQSQSQIKLAKNPLRDTRIRKVRLPSMSLRSPLIQVLLHASLLRARPLDLNSLSAISSNGRHLFTPLLLHPDYLGTVDKVITFPCDDLLTLISGESSFASCLGTYQSTFRNTDTPLGRVGHVFVHHFTQ
jgi:hypothetical protein